ncbi:hypothetical protein UP90_25025 [Escherichia coli]|nr:hypothetical protein UP90_25025 [Escherichia coli]
MILGGVAQMLAPKAKVPEYKSTDNGRQNTYFSSLDNMIAVSYTHFRAHATPEQVVFRLLVDKKTT